MTLEYERSASGSHSEAKLQCSCYDVHYLQQDHTDEGKILCDWWSKYYYSLGKDKKKVQPDYISTHKDKIVIYPNELERNFADR